MKLHQNKSLFQEAIIATSQQLDISEIYIEKDYWVTYALQLIYNDEIGKEVVFKGGTALSKCFKIIERFSEDIDLVVLQKEGETGNQLKNKNRKVSKLVAKELPEVDLEGITNKKGMIRKTAHQYPHTFEGQLGQIREFIILETSWLGNSEPYETRRVISFIGQMMLDNNQEKIAQEYGLLPFEVQVLKPTRTICEKIMSLVRFSYGKEPLVDLRNKVRHIYDLHQLLQSEEFLNYFQSKAFDEMLIKVGKDDIRSFKNNNEWLENHPMNALVFENVEQVWKELSPIYKGDFADLVYGHLPPENEVMKTLKMIRSRLQKISWNLE